MEQVEHTLLEEGDYSLYIRKAEECMGRNARHVKVSLTKLIDSEPICWLYISSTPSARRYWKRKLREYSDEAGLPRSLSQNEAKVIDFMHALRSKNVLLNVRVEHMLMYADQVGLSVQLRSPRK